MSDGTGFSERDFKIAMSQFCTGVVIVTGIDAGRPVGFSAQSFVSLSLQPPLVAISPANSGSSWPRLRASGHFGINILGADQRELCATFARPGADKFAGVQWTAGISGAPIIDGVSSFVDCRIEHEHEAGDHSLVIGRVLDLRVFCSERAPLLFFRGAYGSFTSLPTRDAPGPQRLPEA